MLRGVEGRFFGFFSFLHKIVDATKSRPSDVRFSRGLIFPTSADIRRRTNVKNFPGVAPKILGGIIDIFGTFGKTLLQSFRQVEGPAYIS
jgi:hypothetical protein